MGGGISATDIYNSRQYEINSSSSIVEEILKQRELDVYPNTIQNSFEIHDRDIDTGDFELFQMFQKLGNDIDKACNNVLACKRMQIDSPHEFLLEMIRNKEFLELFDLSINELDNLSNLSESFMATIFESMSSDRNQQYSSMHTSNDVTDLPIRPFEPINSIYNSELSHRMNLENERYIRLEDGNIHDNQHRSRGNSDSSRLNHSLNEGTHRIDYDSDILSLDMNIVEHITCWTQRSFIIPQSILLSDERRTLWNPPETVSDSVSLTNIVLPIISQVTSIRIRICFDTITDSSNVEDLLKCIIGIMESDVIGHINQMYTCQAITRLLWHRYISKSIRIVDDLVTFERNVHVFDDDITCSVSRISLTDPYIEISLFIDQNNHRISFSLNDHMVKILTLPDQPIVLTISMAPGTRMTLLDTRQSMHSMNEVLEQTNAAYETDYVSNELSVEPMVSIGEYELSNQRVFPSYPEDSDESSDIEALTASYHTSSVDEVNQDTSYSNSQISNDDMNELLRNHIDSDVDTLESGSVEVLMFPSSEPRIVSTHKSSPRKSESKSDESMCCICLARVKCVVLIPCRHLCMCEHCGDEKNDEFIDDCPLCRKKIRHRLRVFV